mmetsp:Transcript_15414/g.23250  ORF Transcript_15414/g.23250 Transcript_15414/m.23250 type:complete len:153 (+) Transcript_15414:73-531(+)
MRLVVQRVTSARVATEAAGLLGEIGKGLCVLVGIGEGDGPQEVEWCTKTLLTTKFWPDENDRPWKVALQNTDYKILVVSQFTLYAKLYKKGKLDFHHAMAPDSARELYNDIVVKLREALGQDRVEQGEFGAYMQVSIENDGPVTVNFESTDK